MRTGYLIAFGMIGAGCASIANLDAVDDHVAAGSGASSSGGTTAHDGGLTKGDAAHTTSSSSSSSSGAAASSSSGAVVDSGADANTTPAGPTPCEDSNACAAEPDKKLCGGDHTCVTYCGGESEPCLFAGGGKDTCCVGLSCEFSAGKLKCKQQQQR